MTPLAQPFELDPETYDALVDWPKRLANEGPFFRRRFAEVGARRVLDVACGTGHHAALFHSWDLEVDGADVEPAMIAYCGTKHGQSEKLRWTTRSFTTTPPDAGSFDAVVCLGNSLALAPERDTAAQVLTAMLAALRAGGVGIIQVLNLWRLCEGPTTWQKCVRLSRNGSDTVLIKGIHRVGDRGFIDFGELRLSPGAWSHRFHSTTLLGLGESDLRAAVREVGGCDVHVWGTYGEDSYEPSHSADLILAFRCA